MAFKEKHYNKFQQPNQQIVIQFNDYILQKCKPNGPFIINVRKAIIIHIIVNMYYLVHF